MGPHHSTHNGAVDPAEAKEFLALWENIDIQFDQQDEAIFGGLMATEGKTAQELIPDNIEPAVLWRWFQVTARSIRYSEDVVDTLKPLIGRMLGIIQQHPHLYRQFGYKRFEDFVAQGVRRVLRMPRSEGFRLKRMAGNVPGIASNVLADLGTKRLETISIAVERSVGRDATVEMKETAAREWVTRTLENDWGVDQLRSAMADRHLIEAGELDRATYLIAGTKLEIEQIRQVIAEERIQLYVGSRSPGSIICRALDEASTEWMAQAQQNMMEPQSS